MYSFLIAKDFANFEITSLELEANQKTQKMNKVVEAHASDVTKMKTIKVTDAQHHMLQVLVMFGHENEIPEQEGWNIQTYNNLFDEVMK